MLPIKRMSIAARRLLRAGAALLCLAGCHTAHPGAHSQPGAAQASDTLRIGYQKSGALHVLRLRGGLDTRMIAQGVHVEWLEFPAGPQMLEALAVGSIDLGSTGDAPVVFAQAAGIPLVYVANSPPDASGEDRAILVAQNSPIHSVADLRGKRIAIQKGSGTHNFLVQALQKSGVAYGDVHAVYLPPPDARPAFQSGSVDAWAIWEPYLSIARQATGARVLVNGRGIVSAGGFYLSSRAYATQHADRLKTALEEIQRTGEWSRQHPHDAAVLLAPHVKLDVVLLEQIQTRTYPPGQKYVGLRPISDDVMQAQQTVADNFYSIGLLPHKVNVRDALLTPQQYAGLASASVAQGTTR